MTAAKDAETAEAALAASEARVQAALAGVVKVRELDMSSKGGWDDKNGRFCMPLSDGYYVKFPSDSSGLFCVWFHNEIIGGDRMMGAAKKRAQDHHNAATLANITPDPTALADARRVTPQRAAEVLRETFSDGGNTRIQAAFWKDYVKIVRGGTDETHYHGLRAGLRAIAANKGGA